MSSVKLKVKRLHPLVGLPAYASGGAACLDIRVFQPNTVSPVIYPGETVSLPTGLAFEVPDGYELQVRPRSGFSLHSGLQVILGTIDSDYRGEVRVLITNTSAEEAYVRHNERIAQIIVKQVPKVEVVEVNDLTETARHDGGFGSTGAT